MRDRIQERQRGTKRVGEMVRNEKMRAIFGEEKKRW